MSNVISADGTSIAFERSGSGPPLILVGGALSDRSASSSLAARLVGRFTVYAFDRRGRGESGDSVPYSAEREIEDIAALLDEVGGPAYIYGHSSGAVLSLDAANRLAGFERLAVYEPPFVVDSQGDRPPEGYMQRIAELLESGGRTQAVEYFLTVAAGFSPETLGQIKSSSAWERMERLAHTILYDRAVMGSTLLGRPLPRERWSR